MIIQLHNPQTWPDDIKKFIIQHTHVICSYVETFKKCEASFDFPNEETLEELMIGDAKYEAFEVFSKKLRLLLNPHRLEMVHCTKLLPHEIENIYKSGLRILTADLVKERINAAFERGFIDAQERDFLFADYHRKLESCFYQSRLNQLWFVTPKHLRSQICGVERLFTSWGGESVYNEHDNMETDIARKLKRMGTPCIVKAKVLIADLQIGNIVNAMIYTSGVAANLGYYYEFCDTEGDIEGYIEKDLEGIFVEEIIDFYNPKFSELYSDELLAELEEVLSINQKSKRSIKGKLD